MKQKLRWGVLGAAKIAVQKVIPGMRQCELSEVTAIASRDPARARQAAEQLGVAKSYGSYEELLADEEVDVIYNPLPNHLHVPWTVRAAKAGKHVLCEKPIALSSEEALELIEVRDQSGVLIQEAFMVRSHPQWLGALRMVRSGRIGTLRLIQGGFSYHNTDPSNVRNVPAYGGGGTMDIGCYPIIISRWFFGEEPRRALGLVEMDPRFQVDRLVSAVLDFPSGQSSFFCSTQLVPYQRMQFFGERGRVEVQIPFNAPPDRPCRVVIDGADLFGKDMQIEEFPVCDQYGLQADHFSRAVLGEAEQVLSLEDSVGNMKTIEAVLRSGKTGRWENISI